MTFKPTQVHREELLARAAKVRLPHDANDVLASYDVHAPQLRKPGRALLDRMIDHASAVAELLRHPGMLDEHNTRIAVAALQYFLDDHDRINEREHGEAGLVDDALVLEAAMEVLQSARS